MNILRRIGMVVGVVGAGVGVILGFAYWVVVEQWIRALGWLSLLVVLTFVAHFLRNRFAAIEQNWQTGVVPGIALFLSHLVLWWMLPDFWWNFYNRTGFALLQVLVIFGCYASTLESTAAKRFGNAFIIFGTLFLALNVTLATIEAAGGEEKVPLSVKIKNEIGWLKEKIFGKPIEGDTSTATPPERVLRVYDGPVNEAMVEILRAGLRNGGLPADEVAVMVEHCKWESGGCNQFNADGSLVENSHPDSSAVGMLQILEKLHAEDIKEQGVNVRTVDGQIKFALFLIERRKANSEEFDADWSETSPFMSNIALVSVPVGTWSEPHYSTTLCDGTPNRNMKFKGDDRVVYDIHVDGKLYVEGTNTEAPRSKSWNAYFMVTDGLPGKVVRRCD